MRWPSTALPLLAALAGCAAGRVAPPASPVTDLHYVSFGGERPRDVRTLFVVLNGDGLPAERSDHYAFAATLTRRVPDSAAVAILRPGYADAAGNVSPGERGNDRGDNYTLDRVRWIGRAVAALRARYPKARVVVAGESGGGAIAAGLAGLEPGLVDGLVVVGCPCSLPEWRAFQAKRAPRGGWQAALPGVDPLRMSTAVDPDVRAAVIVGADDTVTPTQFSRAYAEALILRGVATDYRILPGRGHEILNDPDVVAAAEQVARELAGSHGA